MTIFKDYASYYDYLYKDRDYDTEADFVIALINKHFGQAKTILDLGCGTGIHALRFARQGLSVCGVDISPGMLEQAKRKRQESIVEMARQLSFIPGDIRHIRIPQAFDVVTALFHVMSYQQTNEDLLAVFETARVHLRQPGFFLFDAWYGPGVLSDRPEIRVKKIQTEHLEIIREAVPELNQEKKQVAVHYSLNVKNKSSSEQTTHEETHLMRYLFCPEVEEMALKTGFKEVEAFEWLSEKRPQENSWSVGFLCKT